MNSILCFLQWFFYRHGIGYAQDEERELQELLKKSQHKYPVMWKRIQEIHLESKEI